MLKFTKKLPLALVVFTTLTLASIALSSHPGHHFQLKSNHKVTLTADAVSKVQNTMGEVSDDKKTLTFKDKDIRLVVTTGPEEDMLSFRIQGLRNPTLVIPAGATLRVLFINSDDDMLHDIRFADEVAPFEANPTLKNSIGSHDLTHKSDTSMHGEELVVIAPTVAGTHSYLCKVSGHAKGGMFGSVTVQ